MIHTSISKKDDYFFAHNAGNHCGCPLQPAVNFHPTFAIPHLATLIPPFFSFCGAFSHSVHGILHATITKDAWTSLYRLPPPSDQGTPLPLLLTSGGHHWTHAQTCSPQDSPLPQSNIWWWLSKHIWSVQADG